MIGSSIGKVTYREPGTVEARRNDRLEVALEPLD